MWAFNIILLYIENNYVTVIIKPASVGYCSGAHLLPIGYNIYYEYCMIQLRAVAVFQSEVSRRQVVGNRQNARVDGLG